MTDTATPVTWIDEADVARALGPTAGFAADPYAPDVVAAANAAAYRKRAAAGYLDDPTVAPDDAAKYGTVLWAVALWRERASTDGYTSFADLAGFQPVGGSWGQIRRMLGIGRAQVDAPRPDPSVNPLGRWPV